MRPERRAPLLQAIRDTRHRLPPSARLHARVPVRRTLAAGSRRSGGLPGEHSSRRSAAGPLRMTRDTLTSKLNRDCRSPFGSPAARSGAWFDEAFGSVRYRRRTAPWYRAPDALQSCQREGIRLDRDGISSFEDIRIDPRNMAWHAIGLRPRAFSSPGKCNQDRTNRRRMDLPQSPSQDFATDDGCAGAYRTSPAQFDTMGGTSGTTCGFVAHSCPSHVRHGEAWLVMASPANRGPAPSDEGSRGSEGTRCRRRASARSRDRASRSPLRDSRRGRFAATAGRRNAPCGRS